MPALTTTQRIRATVGVAVIFGTWFYLVFTRPTDWESVGGSSPALITLGGYVLGAILLLSASLPILPARTIAIIPAALVLNIVIGQIVGSVGIPLYLDSVGTVLVAGLAGPIAGLATGTLSSIVWGLFNPAALPFAATYRDGLVTAGQLSLRFAALIAALLAALTAVRIPELVKALQTARIHHSISFILGSAIQFLPQAHDITRCMRDACRLAGRTPHPGNLVIPVLVQVLYHGGQRAIAMITMGLELPGRRTVLRPPPDSPIQKLVRILLPLAAITLVVTV